MSPILTFPFFMLFSTILSKAFFDRNGATAQTIPISMSLTFSASLSKVSRSVNGARLTNTENGIFVSAFIVSSTFSSIFSGVTSCPTCAISSKETPVSSFSIRRFVISVSGVFSPTSSSKLMSSILQSSGNLEMSGIELPRSQLDTD